MTDGRDIFEGSSWGPRRVVDSRDQPMLIRSLLRRGGGQLLGSRVCLGIRGLVGLPGGLRLRVVGLRDPSWSLVDIWSLLK